MNVWKYIVVVAFFSFMPKIKAITSIKVDDYELVPFFTDYITKYNVFVTGDDDSVNITASLSEEDDYITGIGNVNILDGKTEVTLKLVKKDKEIIDYQIKIFKNYEENDDYDDALLNKLEIKGHDINFNPNLYEYEINVDNEERLEIEYEQNSEHSTVKISGNSNFKVGQNTIKITVISKNQNYNNIYIIRVNKVVDVFNEETSSMEEETNILGKETLTKKEVNIITLVIITICFILIIFIFYLLFGLKKRKC